MTTTNQSALDERRVQELVEAYRKAAHALDAIQSKVERAVGAGALYTNAQRTLAHIESRAVGLPAGACAPLQRWIESYTEGSAAPNLVTRIDSAIRQAAKGSFKDVALWAFAGSSIPLCMAVFGAVAFAIINFGHMTFARLLTALASGAIPSVAIYAALRASPGTGTAIAGGVGETWNAAATLGREAEQVLVRTSLPIEQGIWRAVGHTPHPGFPFVARARRLAQIIIGAIFLLAAVGVILFLIGADRAYQEWSTAPPIRFK